MIFSAEDGSALDPEVERAARLRWAPPDNEVPGQLGTPTILAVTDDAAVLLLAVRHHSAGLLLTFQFLTRIDAEPSGFPDDSFIGLELGDGRRVVFDPHRMSDEDPYVLNHRGGGGGGRQYELTFWFTPAPPPGDVTVVVHALRFGLPEGRIVLPAADLAAARAQVRELWPWTPERPDRYQPPPRPAPPTGGWFDTADSSHQP